MTDEENFMTSNIHKRHRQTANLRVCRLSLSGFHVSSLIQPIRIDLISNDNNNPFAQANGA